MKIVIIGNSSYSQMLKTYIEDMRQKVTAYAVDEKFITAEKLDNCPVVAIEELIKQYSPKEYLLAMGIGYKKLGKVRQDMFSRCKSMGYSFINYVHPSAIIDRSVKIGEANVIFENVVIQKNAVIGNGNLFFSNSVVMHDDKIEDFITFGACSVANGFVTVEDCCFIGANATIRDGVTIKTNSLVGAGAYINASTERDMVILPARVRRRGVH